MRCPQLAEKLRNLGTPSPNACVEQREVNKLLTVTYSLLRYYINSTFASKLRCGLFHGWWKQEEKEASG